MAKYTQTQLDKLNEAIALGALVVWYGDKKVEYRSLDEMLTIQAKMETYLAVRKGSQRTTGVYNKFN